MVVQAGAFQPYVPGEAPVAGPQTVEFIQQFYCIFHRCRTGIRTKILGFILFHEPGELDAGIVLPQGYLDIGIGLVVL